MLRSHFPAMRAFHSLHCRSRPDGNFQSRPFGLTLPIPSNACTRSLWVSPLTTMPNARLGHPMRAFARNFATHPFGCRKWLERSQVVHYRATIWPFHLAFSNECHAQCSQRYHGFTCFGRSRDYRVAGRSADLVDPETVCQSGVPVHHSVERACYRVVFRA